MGVEHSVGFWWGNLKENHHFEYLDAGERIILKCLSNMLSGRELSLSVAELEHWLIILNASVNTQFLYNVRNFLTS